MKRRVDFFKYIIRFVGSVCILASAALLVFSPIIEIDGVKNKEFRSAYSQFEELSKLEETWLLRETERKTSAVKEELRDYDLPYRKSELKAWFRNINGLAKETLNSSITLEEVFTLVWNAPELVNDVENLMETDTILEDGINILVRYDEKTFGSEFMHEKLDEVEEHFAAIRNICYLLIVLFAVLALLVVAAVIGNILNKGRGIKYVVLVIVAAITVGCYIGVPSLSGVLSDAVAENELLKDMELCTTAVPVLACILLIIPAVLDFWNKKRAEKALKNGKAYAEPVVRVPAVQEIFVKEEETAVQVPAQVADNPQPVRMEAIADDAAPVEPVKKEKKTFRIKMPKCPAFISRNDVLRKIFEKIRQKGKYIGIGAAAAAVAAVIVLALHLAGNTYKTPIRVMEKNANTKEFSFRYHLRLDHLNGLMAEESKEIIAILKESDEFSDLIEDLEDVFIDSIEDMKDEYGSDYKYTYKILEKEELDRKELRAFRDKMRDISDAVELMEEEFDYVDSDEWEDMADEVGLSKSQLKSLVRQIFSMGKVCKNADVSDGYELTVLVTLTGREMDEPEENEITVCVYKVDGRWISDSSIYAMQQLSEPF